MLSRKEKDLLNLLVTIKYANLWVLAEKKFTFELTKNDGTNYCYGQNVIKHGDKVYKVSLETEREVFTYVAFIEMFIRKMENEGLLVIQTVPNHDTFHPFLYSEKVSSQVSYKMNELKKKYQTITICFNDTINTFINNGYMTESEIDRMQTRKLAKLSLIVSIFAIVIPVITAAITTYFSYKNYTTERIVTINTNDQMKLPIEIVNKIEIDKEKLGAIPVDVAITVNHEYPKKDK